MVLSGSPLRGELQRSVVSAGIGLSYSNLSYLALGATRPMGLRRRRRHLHGPGQRCDRIVCLLAPCFLCDIWSADILAQNRSWARAYGG